MAYSDEKTYGSAKYHGMKVGGRHFWTYPDGQWTERKVAPDRWEVSFTSLKRRNRKAPTGSGAEVGSGYHWLIVAHQWVDKLDANTYATQMEGRKVLIAFRKPDWPVWNTQFKNARRGAKERTIAALQDLIRSIEEGDEDLEDVVDQAALVDLAATFEAEEGLPPGSVPRPGAPAPTRKAGVPAMSPQVKRVERAEGTRPRPKRGQPSHRRGAANSPLRASPRPGPPGR